MMLMAGADERHGGDVGPLQPGEGKSDPEPRTGEHQTTRTQDRDEVSRGRGSQREPDSSFIPRERDRQDITHRCVKAEGQLRARRRLLLLLARTDLARRHVQAPFHPLRPRYPLHARSPSPVVMLMC